MFGVGAEELEALRALAADDPEDVPAAAAPFPVSGAFWRRLSIQIERHLKSDGDQVLPERYRDIKLKLCLPSIKT